MKKKGSADAAGDEDDDARAARAAAKRDKQKEGKSQAERQLKATEDIALAIGKLAEASMGPPPKLSFVAQFKNNDDFLKSVCKIDDTDRAKISAVYHTPDDLVIIGEPDLKELGVAAITCKRFMYHRAKYS